MESIIPHVDPQIALPLLKILQPANPTQEVKELNLKILCRTALFDQMRSEQIPEDLFSDIEAKSNKNFEQLTSKYQKILKLVDNKKFSSINKELLLEKNYLRDLHFSIENFNLLFKISKGLVDRAKFRDALVLLQLLEVTFQEQIPNKLSFYWAKVISYLALVLQRGTTSLGSKLNGAKKKFRKDLAALWSQIELISSEASEFDVQAKQRAVNLKMGFLRLQVIQDYVVKKSVILARNQTDQEDLAEKIKRKKSKKLSSRKNTKKSSADIKVQNDTENRKLSENGGEPSSQSALVNKNQKNQKIGKALHLILNEIGLANFDWNSPSMIELLASIFILESEPSSLHSLKNMGQSIIHSAYQEIKFYLESQNVDIKQHVLLKFLSELIENFDFEAAGAMIQKFKSKVDHDWIFGNFKGEIVNKMLAIMVIVYNKIVNEIDLQFLEKVLGLNQDAVADLLKETGIGKGNMTQIKEESRLHQMDELIKQLQNELD